MYSFELMDTKGNLFSSEELRDRYYIVIFLDINNKDLFSHISEYIDYICKKRKIKKESCEILVICRKNLEITSSNYRILIDNNDEVSRVFGCVNKGKNKNNKKNNKIILVDPKGEKKHEETIKEHIEFKIFFKKLGDLVKKNDPELFELLFFFDSTFRDISSTNVTKYTSFENERIQNHLRNEQKNLYENFINEVIYDSNKRETYISRFIEITKCEKESGTILGMIDNAIGQDEKILPKERNEYRKCRELNKKEQTAYSLLIYIAILVRQIISPQVTSITKEVEGYLPIRATINPYLNTYLETNNSFCVSLDEKTGCLVKSSLNEEIIDEAPENLFSFMSQNSPTLICGESGMGKTQILTYFMKELQKEKRDYAFIKAFDLYNEIQNIHTKEGYESVYEKYCSSKDIVLMDGLNEVLASGYNSFDSGTAHLSYFFKEFILKRSKTVVITGIVGYKYVEVKNQFGIKTIVQLDGLKNKENTDYLRIPIYENIRRELGVFECTTYGLVDSLFENRCKKIISIPDKKSEEYFCFLESLPEKAFNLLSGKDECSRHNEIVSSNILFEFSPFVEIKKDNKQQKHAFFSHDIYVVYFAAKYILDRVRDMKDLEYSCFFSDENKVSFDKFQPSFTFREMLVSAFFTDSLSKKLISRSNVLIDGLNRNIPFYIKLMLIEIYYIIADAIGDPFWGQEAKNLKKKIQLEDVDFYDKTINIYFDVIKNGIKENRSILLKESNRWLTRQILCRKQIQLHRIKEDFDYCLKIINEMEDIFKNEKDFIVELEHQRAKIYLDRRKDAKEFRDGLTILEKIVIEEKTFTFSINLLGMIKAYPTPAVVKLLGLSERKIIEGFKEYYKLVEATKNDNYIEPSTGYAYRRIAAMLLFNHVAIHYYSDNCEIPSLLDFSKISKGKEGFPSLDNITLASLLLEKADDHSYTEFLKALLYYYKDDYSLAASFVEQSKKQGENGIMLRMLEIEISDCSEEEKNERRNSLIQEINNIEGGLPERVKKSILDYNSICEKYNLAYVVFDIFQLMKAIQIKKNNELTNPWIRLWERDNFHKDPLFTNSYMNKLIEQDFSETEMIFWSSLFKRDIDIDKVYGKKIGRL